MLFCSFGIKLVRSSKQNVDIGLYIHKEGGPVFLKIKLNIDVLLQIPEPFQKQASMQACVFSRKVDCFLGSGLLSNMGYPGLGLPFKGPAAAVDS